MLLNENDINIRDLKQFKAFLFYGRHESLQYFIADQIKEKLRLKNTIIIDYSEEENSFSGIIENEYNSIDLFPSSKLIKIYNFKNKASKVIQDAIKQNKTHEYKKIIIIGGDNIDGKSAIKNFFEKELDLGLIACYEDDKNKTSEIIKKYITDNKISLELSQIEEIAISLQDRFQNDRYSLINELEQIKILLSINHNNSLNIGLFIQNISYHDNIEGNIFALIDNILAGDKQYIIKSINSTINSQNNLIGLIRMFLHSMKTLHTLLKKIEMNKVSLDEAIKSEFIFFKRIPIIKRQIKNNSLVKISNAIIRMKEMEDLSKWQSQEVCKVIMMQFLLNY